LDALIFDFDGVVVDSEPIHLVCFDKVLQSVGIRLTEADYYGKYLGYDDHDCFAAAMRDNGADFTEEQIALMIAEKTELVKRAYGESIKPMPGAVELIRSAAGAGLPLAICSGGLREEIRLAAETVGVLDCFEVIVPAEDVPRGKPDPAGYRLARRRLEETNGRLIAAERCVVVEDSPAGIAAAHAAGMKVLAVTNSYPPDALDGAERIVDSLEEVPVASLDELITQ